MVEVEDIDENVLEYVLWYIYTGQLWFEKWSNSAAKVDANNFFLAAIHAADKYGLRCLIESLEILLLSTFDTDSYRIAQLVSADRHQLRKLKLVCLAALGTDIGSVDPKLLPPDLLSELMKEATKIQRSTKMIEVETKHVMQGD